MLHISSRIEQPVFHHIARLVACGIMPSKEPEGVALHQYGGVSSMFVADYGVAVALELMLQHIAPFLLQALQLVGSHRHHRTMTGKEVLAERLRLLGKRLQVLRPLELVAARAIEVVHENVFLSTFKYATTFHMRPRTSIGIDILEVFLIWSCQLLRRCLLDAIFEFLAVSILRVAFIEKVVHTVLVDDVVVYRAILRLKQHLRLALESREVLVGIGIVGDERLAVVTLQGKVNHILPGLAVVDGLRRPHPVGIAEVLAPVLREVDLRVRPINEVFRLQQHDARIRPPPLFRVEHMHVRCHDIVATVLTS